MNTMTSVRWLPVILIALALSACGDPAADLVGTWVQVAGSRPESTLRLMEDGTGEFQPRGGVKYRIERWAVRADYLEMDIPGQPVVAQFVLDDTMELSRVEEFQELNGTYRRR